MHLQHVPILRRETVNLLSVVQAHPFEHRRTLNVLKGAPLLLDELVPKYLRAKEPILIDNLDEWVGRSCASTTHVLKKLHMFLGKIELCFFEFADWFVEDYHLFVTDFVLEAPIIINPLRLNPVPLEMLNVNIDLSQPISRIKYASLNRNMNHIPPM